MNACQNSERDKKSQVLSWILRLLIKLVDSGALAVLPGSTVKVYLLLLRYRFKDKPAFMVSTQRLMEGAGINKRHTFFNALNQLEAAGLMKPRKRGPKQFHYMNIYDIPLDPCINRMNLRAELNLQKKRRTIVPKKGIKVNGKLAKKGGVPKMGTATIVPKMGTATLVPKMGTNKYVNEVNEVNIKGSSPD